MHYIKITAPNIQLQHRFIYNAPLPAFKLHKYQCQQVLLANPISTHWLKAGQQYFSKM